MGVNPPETTMFTAEINMFTGDDILHHSPLISRLRVMYNCAVNCVMMEDLCAEGAGGYQEPQCP